MKFILLFCLVWGYSVLFCQQEPQKFVPLGEPGGRIFYEVLSFPSNKENNSRIIINTKILFDFVTMVRKSNEVSDEFKGALDLSVEIFDKEKNSVAREIFQKEISQTDEERKIKFRDFIEASLEFYIKPGKYNVIFEINDKESQRSIKKELIDFNIKDYKTRILSDIVFIKKYSSADKIIRFVNESGNIPYGENVDLFFILENNIKIDSIYLEIFKLKDKEIFPFFAEKYSQGSVLFKKNIKHLEKSGSEYEIINDDKYSLLILPLKSDSFDLQKYRATVTVYYNNSKDTVEKRFESLWMRMPFSLRDFRNAQSKVSFIASESEYNELTRGSLEVQREKFIEYWKKKDPTPNTAFNEIMAEYYRRVDFAALNYSTFKEPDGSKSDRGKIYILNGKPDDINRQLIPGGPSQEMWTYKKMSKKYIFIDEFKQGNFNLSRIEKL